MQGFVLVFVKLNLVGMFSQSVGLIWYRYLTSTVGNLKIARSERSNYCYIHMPTFRVVSLLRNLSLGGKLCRRDDNNTAFV